MTEAIPPVQTADVADSAPALPGAEKVTTVPSATDVPSAFVTVAFTVTASLLLARATVFEAARETAAGAFGSAPPPPPPPPHAYNADSVRIAMRLMNFLDVMTSSLVDC
jgi:hypothetical protein